MSRRSDEPEKRKGRSAKKEGQKKGKSKRKPGKAGAKKRRTGSQRSIGEQRANHIKAIDHPLRRRILRILNQDDKPLSPNQVSRELKMPLGSVSYQTRVLRKLGAIKLAASRQVRGALEHFHVSMIAKNQSITALLDETRVFDEETAEELGPPS